MGPENEHTDDAWVAQGSQVNFDNTMWQVTDVVPDEAEERHRTVILQEQGSGT